MLTSAGVRSAGCAALAVLGAAASMAAPPLDPPRQYEVRGTGYATIAGPHCCGDTRFTGRFDGAYQIASSGQALLTSLRFSLDDAEADVHDGFLGLFNQTIRLRCTALGLTSRASGMLVGGEIHFPSGVVALRGRASEERLADGSCGPPTLRLNEAANTVPLRLVHDPAGDRVSLDATFTGAAEGGSYTVALRMTGQFDNRPPWASMQFETAAAPQGVGCPAVSVPNQGLVAEANHPSGYLARLRSSTADPDGPPGASTGADLLSERWMRSRDGGPRVLFGVGYRSPQTTFEWGPTHRVELLSMDQSGATAAAQCSFRVVDSRKPVVTAPPAKTVACSQPDGASASTSAAVTAFLAGASAYDGVDPLLTALPARVGGVDVTPTTLFPGGATRQVTFRFRDDWGNVGSAVSNLTVADGAPALTVTVSPSQFPVDHQWHWISVSPVATDCGPVTLKLHKVVSNAPEHDDTDISSDSVGTDDRLIAVYARLAPLNKPRIYSIWYRATDAAGNSTLRAATVTVKPLL
jgi:hypothetical protein